jgi:hypothetical protein
VKCSASGPARAYPEDVLGPLELDILTQHLANSEARRRERQAVAGDRLVELDCETAGRLVPCMACVLDGPERCYEFNLAPEVHAACVAEARRLSAARAGERCHDCAFRHGSPESREEDLLAKHIRSSTPFRCHQAMPLDGRGRLPTLGDFAPLDPDAYPVCAGWAAARASWLRRRRTWDAVRQLARGRVPTTRARWYAAIGLRSWRPRHAQPPAVPTTCVIDPARGPWLCTTRRRLALRAALRIERQREVWLGGERVGVIQLAGGAHRVEDTSGAGPAWIFGAPALALDAFAVWLARAGRMAPSPAPRPPRPDGPGKPPKRPPGKRRRLPRQPSRTMARAA